MPRVTITVPDRTPQPYRFPLDTRLVSLGRGSDNDIVIDCGSVSVRHAEMERLDSGYILRDLGSTNGTKVEGERKHVIELRHGMVVLLGDVEFDFQLSEEEREQLAANAPEVPSPPKDEHSPPALPPLKSEASEKSEDKEKNESADKERDKEKHHKPSSGRNTRMSGFSLFVVFLLLAAIAFVIGLSMRHHHDTGTWILSQSTPDVRRVTAPEQNASAVPETAPTSPVSEPAPPVQQAAPVTEPTPPAAQPAAPATEPAPPATQPKESTPPPTTEPAAPSTEPAAPAAQPTPPASEPAAPAAQPPPAASNV